MAEFLTKAGTLRTAVHRAASAVMKRAPVPVLDHLLLSASSGSLSIVGTDMEVMVNAWAAGDGNLPVITADARALCTILDGLAEDEGLILRDLGGKYLEVGARSGLVARLLSHPPADFPDPHREKRNATWSIQAKALHNMLASVQHAVSTEETRYYLNGAYLHMTADGSRLLVAATDGHRLMERCCPAPAGEAVLPMILPRHSIRTLLPLLDAQAGTVDVLQGELCISILGSDWRLHSKAIDGVFPDYARVVPREPGTELTVHDPARFAALAQAVSGAHAERRDCPKLMRISRLEDGRFRISAEADETGNVHAIVPAEVASWGVGFDLDVGFQHRYLADAIAAFPDGFTMHVIDGKAPCRLTAEGALGVLMPMRLS